MAEHDPLTATTLTELMRRRAAVSPDTPYFHLYGETVTYGRLWAQSARYAAGLAAHGVKPGDKVCLIYPPCAEFFYKFFGAVRLSAVPVPRGGGRSPARRPFRLLAAALPRHGVDRAVVHATAHGRARVAAAAGPAQSPAVARADDAGARDLHRVAGLRLPQLCAQRPGHARPRSVLAQGGALGRGARAPVDHSRVRGPLSPEERHRALLRPGRGDARGRRVAARTGHPRRWHRAFRVRRLSVSRRGRAHRAACGRRATGGARHVQRRRDPGEEARRHEGLL